MLTWQNHKNFRFFSALTLGLITLTSATKAEAGCVMYEHRDYRGDRYYLHPGEQVFYVGDDWNDEVSSVNLSAGCHLRVYEHDDFRGEQKTFTRRSQYIGNLWNDEISSAVCSCPRISRSRTDRSRTSRHRKTCTMYEHRDFAGDKYRLRANRRVDYLGNSWNDEISSVKVPRGCRLKVFEHADFRGASRTFRSGRDSYIGRSWNDRISSAACICEN